MKSVATSILALGLFAAGSSAFPSSGTTCTPRKGTCTGSDAEGWSIQGCTEDGVLVHAVDCDEGETCTYGAAGGYPYCKEIDSDSGSDSGDDEDEDDDEDNLCIPGKGVCIGSNEAGWAIRPCTYAESWGEVIPCEEDQGCRYGAAGGYPYCYDMATSITTTLHPTTATSSPATSSTAAAACVVGKGRCAGSDVEGWSIEGCVDPGVYRFAYDCEDGEKCTYGAAGGYPYCAAATTTASSTSTTTTTAAACVVGKGRCTGSDSEGWGIEGCVDPGVYQFAYDCDDGEKCIYGGAGGYPYCAAAAAGVTATSTGVSVGLPSPTAGAEAADVEEPTGTTSSKNTEYTLSFDVDNDGDIDEDDLAGLEEYLRKEFSDDLEM